LVVAMVCDCYDKIGEVGHGGEDSSARLFQEMASEMRPVIFDRAKRIVNDGGAEEA